MIGQIFFFRHFNCELNEGGEVGAEGEEVFFQLGVVFRTVNGSFGGLSSAEPQVGGTTGG